MIYKKKENFIEEQTEGCLIIYDLETDMTHIFNETATYLWKKMTNSGFELDVLINEFIAEFNDIQNLNLDEVYSDCLECIEKIYKQGLLIKIDDEHLLESE